MASYTAACRRLRQACKMLRVAGNHKEELEGEKDIRSELETKIRVWNADDEDTTSTLERKVAIPLTLFAQIHPNIDDLLSDPETDDSDSDDGSDLLSASPSPERGRCTPYYGNTPTDFWDRLLETVKTNDVRGVGTDQNGEVYVTMLSPPPLRSL